MHNFLNEVSLVYLKLSKRWTIKYYSWTWMATTEILYSELRMYMFVNIFLPSEYFLACIKIDISFYPPFCQSVTSHAHSLYSTLRHGQNINAKFCWCFTQIKSDSNTLWSPTWNKFKNSSLQKTSSLQKFNITKQEKKIFLIKHQDSFSAHTFRIKKRSTLILKRFNING